VWAATEGWGAIRDMKRISESINWEALNESKVIRYLY
jgi:hypothetical protein